MEICRCCLKSSVNLVNVFSKRPVWNCQLSMAKMVNKTVETKMKSDDEFPQKMCLSCSISAKIGFKFKHLSEESAQVLIGETQIESVVKNDVHFQFKQEMTKRRVVNENTQPSSEVIIVLDSDDEIEPERKDVRVKQENTTTDAEIKQTHKQTDLVQKMPSTSNCFESSSEHLKSEIKGKVDFVDTSSSIDGYNEDASYEPPVKIDKDDPLIKDDHFFDSDIDDDVIEMVYCQPQNELQNVFTTNASLDNSKISSNTNVDQQTNDRKHKCVKCPKAFKTSAHLKNHIYSHTGERPYKCSYCPKSFVISTMLKHHINTHTGERPFKCDHCPDTFSSSLLRKLHMFTHVEHPYKCLVCKKTFAYHSHLKSHSLTHTAAQNFKCPNCPRVFASMAHLNSHNNIHISKLPFTCARCPKTFLASWELVKHFQTHTDRSFQCSHCPKLFKTGSDLKKHILTHTGERPHKCTHCQKGFASKSNLNKHVLIHTGEHPHICSQCPKTFVTSTSLKKHIQTHTNERPFKCTHCNSGFATKWDLKKHSYAHLGERPYLSHQ